MNYFNQLINALENKDETSAILIMKEHRKEINKYQEYNGNTILTYAIKNRLSLFANTLLKDEVLLNIPDAYGNTPLHLAINRDLDHLAVQLIKFQAETKIKNNSGVTPLFLALNKGMNIVVEELIQDSKVINQINVDGNNALMVCILKYKETSEKKYNELAKLLINNIDLYYSNQIQDSSTYKENALTLALFNENVDIAKAIIKTGKGINIENKEYKRPITLCIEKGYENLANSILSHNIELGYTILGDTALTLAIKKDCYGIADTIVTKRTLITDKDNHRNTPMALAIQKGLEKLASKMIDIKYSQDDIAYIINDTDYPLTLAIKCNQLKIAEELINKCKDIAINVYDKEGNSPFSLALSKGLDNLCKLMIKNGLKVNDYSNEIETHLTMAMKSGRIEVVKELIQQNVEIKSNKKFESPETICRNYQMSSMLKIIHNSSNHIIREEESLNMEMPITPFKMRTEQQKISSEVKKKIKNML